MALHHLDFEFHLASFPGKKMVEIADLFFSYCHEPLIQQFSLSIEKGEKIAIVGKNGRGKSTLLRLLTKELEPKNGVIKHSENLSIGYFGQTHIDRLNPKHTVEEEIASGNPKLNQTEIKSIAGLMMFSQDQSKKLNSMLSGGEKSRVLLGKIIAKPCNLLLLDEPTHHLDMESIEALIDALEVFEGSVVIVTHSELILKRLNFDKIVICHEQRQDLFLGNYADFLEKDGWQEREEKGVPKPIVHKFATVKPVKSLQTLEREISDRERRINKLEREQEKLTEELLTSDKKQEISKALASKEDEIAQLHREIELLYGQI